MNYESISDFYEYSVPLNSLVIPDYLPDMEKNFQEMYDYKDTTCFTTPNENLFCYSKPHMYEYGISTSYVIGENGFDGEIHFDSIDVGVSYFTMKNMTLINNDTVMITFADKDYRVGNATSTQYDITDKFEFTEIIEKYDTFIVKCNDYDGTSVTIVQYLGIDTIYGIDYFLTWHTPANSEQGVSCDYPQIIQHSLKHNFREL